MKGVFGLVTMVGCAFFLTILVPGAGAQDASPGATPEGECTVAPRSKAEINELASLAATPEAVSAPTGLEGFWEGEPVDAQTLAEITAVLEQVRACEEAGDLPRLLALYTDGFVVREALAGEPVPIVPGTPRPGPGGEETEVPPASFETVVVVEARVLGDGRVMALVSASGGEVDRFVVFAREDGRWRIDLTGAASMMTFTAEASPSASPAVEVPAEVVSLPAVQAALADAVARLGVPADELTVESVATEVWPDASLGCPQEGQFYAQVETPGYRVVISGGGQRVEYHTDESGIVVACEEGGS